MPAIFHSKDILVDYYNNPDHPAWAKDLICRAINTNGTIEQADLYIILDEILNEVTTPSLVIPANFGVAYPKILLNSLKHISGINALANNQEIKFCEEGLTLIFGFNGSGKSSYFRILNMMAITDAGAQMVTSLRDAYNKLSNHGTHVGMGSVMQTLTRQDLVGISTTLRHIYNNANL